MRCRDRNCSPEKGEDGCLASLVNVGAFDALDFVWTRAWDDCPVLKDQGERLDAERHVREQEEAWFEKQARAQEASG